MTEHKFTDEDVIRALECCKMPVGSGACNNCPFDYQRVKRLTGSDKSCTMVMFDCALDLINRQEAEIEELRHKYELAVAEREANVKGFTDVIATAKSEAVKEFANSVKTYYDHIDKTVGVLINYTIDQKLKDFLGEGYEERCV